jgi:hypothetical protein
MARTFSGNTAREMASSSTHHQATVLLLPSICQPISVSRWPSTPKALAGSCHLQLAFCGKPSLPSLSSLPSMSYFPTPRKLLGTWLR